jgi:bifunctional non-homologous end joining protein LigD
MTPATGQYVNVDGHRVRLTNLDKVMYPDTGFTKAEVIDYYARVAPVLLPHLAGRHITLKRFPDGVTGKSFFEKHCPDHRPDWVHTAQVQRSPDSSDRRSRGSSTDGHDGNDGNEAHQGRDDAITFCTVDDTATLVWLANLAALELHAPMAHAHAPDTPAAVVFDLDPGAPADLVDCCQVGLWIRDLLDTVDLRCWAKTSGSKGLQLYVPLNTPVTHEDTALFARTVAHLLEREHPDRVVSTQRKTARSGKVLIDWSQNSWHKTTVSVYSLRARPRPTVSTPVTWDQVERAVAVGDPGNLTLRAPALLDRLDDVGDLFAPVLTERQSLPVLDTPTDD